MGLNCGIIGLPNAGKTTIFNALSGGNAQIANYPFCTIEPNRGVVPVPDERLTRIGELLNKENSIPNRIEFVDVAGLVKGASKGEGLGNRFLGHVRDVDAIIHVIRCFKSQDVVHVGGQIDPIRDVELINTELILSDIEILERAKEKLLKTARSGDKRSKADVETLQGFLDHLDNGKLLNTLHINSDEIDLINNYGLITSKPILYLANVDEVSTEDDELKKVREYAERNGSESLSIMGKLEEEISQLPECEKEDYLKALGLEESGLDRLIKSSLRLLRLITFYTAETDLQAWTILDGTDAIRAAGKIHTDFIKGFIRAEVFSFNDLVNAGTLQRIKDMGLLRSEGRDYPVKDGDIIRFLFNL
ncbi:MAG: redox-regulated ATPase YchF [Spirochaetota bacterium]|nr:redox-regulated ATPase YchF [Spirochaetota bacterium]